MIPIEKLKAVKTIISHKSCADGHASAMILHKALPHADIVFLQYGTSDLEALPATEGLLFCDITPPQDRVQEFVDAGTVVLDHHIGQKAIVEAFGELGVFADEKADPGVSGALLAYRELERLYGDIGYPGEVVQMFAEYVGVRDTWQTHDGRWTNACALSEALRFYPVNYLLDLPIDRWMMDDFGKVLLQKNADRVKTIQREALRFECEGLRCFAFNGSDTSDVAEALGSDIDLVLGFTYFVDSGLCKMRVSTRSRGDFDCMKLAKHYGGGGHSKAAGFVNRSTSADPYTRLMQLVSNYLLMRTR